MQTMTTKSKTMKARVKAAKPAWVRAGLVALLLSAAAVATEAAVAQDADQRPPPRNARFVFQLVEANGFENTDPEIQDVVSELRELFRFDGYRLVDTALLNSAAHGAGARARLAGGAFGAFEVSTWVEETRDPQLLRVSVELRSEEEGSPMEATVNVRDGQTLVLGSTRTSSGAALILIMRTTVQ